MDVQYFLERRLEFIRQFYVNSSAGFIERKRQIEAEEEPYVPPYSEDPEPAFLNEWLEAEESLQVLGRICISLRKAGSGSSLYGGTYGSSSASIWRFRSMNPAEELT